MSVDQPSRNLDHAAGPHRPMRLAVQEGENFSSVHLSMTPEGGIDLTGQDVGPRVRETWGDSDYEYGVRIAPADVARLACALIAEHYRDDLRAVQKVHELAERHGISPGFWTWA